MTDRLLQEPPKEDALAIAIHEAGHLVVGAVCGRKPKKVSLEFVGGLRGCFWEDVDDDLWDDFKEVSGLLAGPRAQVEVFPASIPPERLGLFGERIILPMDGPRMKPDGVYDFLGWQHDIEPVYVRLCMPLAPAHNMPLGVTHEAVVQRAESRLLSFFRSVTVQQKVRQIADRLVADRVVDGNAATAIVVGAGILGMPETIELSRWEQ